MILYLVKRQQRHVLVGRVHDLLAVAPAHILHAVLRHHEDDRFLPPAVRKRGLLLRKRQFRAVGIPVKITRHAAVDRRHIGELIALVDRVKRTFVCRTRLFTDGQRQIVPPQLFHERIAHGDGLLLRDFDVLQRVRLLTVNGVPLQDPELRLNVGAQVPVEPEAVVHAVKISGVSRFGAHRLRGSGQGRRLRRQWGEGLLLLHDRGQLRLEPCDILLLPLIGAEDGFAGLRILVHNLSLLDVLQRIQNLLAPVRRLAQLHRAAEEHLRRLHHVLRGERRALHRQHGILHRVRHLDGDVDAHRLPAHVERFRPALRRFILRRRRGRGLHRLLQRPVQPVHDELLLRRRLAAGQQRRRHEQREQQAKYPGGMRPFHVGLLLFMSRQNPSMNRSSVISMVSASSSRIRTSLDQSTPPLYGYPSSGMGRAFARRRR